MPSEGWAYHRQSEEMGVGRVVDGRIAFFAEPLGEMYEQVA